MPFLFWLDLAALGFCALVGTSLLLTTLAAGTRWELGVRFAAFAALMAAWAVTGLGLKFSLWLGSDAARLWLELGALSFGLLAPAALAFAARCAQARTRGPDLAALAGILAMAALAVPMFSPPLPDRPGAGARRHDPCSRSTRRCTRPACCPCCSWSGRWSCCCGSAGGCGNRWRPAVSCSSWPAWWPEGFCGLPSPCCLWAMPWPCACWATRPCAASVFNP